MLSETFLNFYESSSSEDLVVGNTIYRSNEVDRDEYNYMKKMVDRAIKDNEKTEELLKTRFLDNDTSKIKDSLNANKKLIKHWKEVEPWMLGILKDKKDE